jgi:hypothetical protein
LNATLKRPPLLVTATNADERQRGGSKSSPPPL